MLPGNLGGWFWDFWLLLRFPFACSYFIIRLMTDEADGVSETGLQAGWWWFSDGDADLGFPAGFSGAGLRNLCPPKDGLGNKSCTM